ncbi:hypothetical protein PIB30_023686 [Stylosanthes scabra]|uniref:GRF-type domain-containing protein n=1 Tax=Stylosanthes scabra TaxID=79078 RepID=A0ABU6TB99_9FABA|nr:hypothetical protein [Stylosanthes scabra]
MNPSQGMSSILVSSGSSSPRTQDLSKRRHLCFCGEAVIVLASTVMSSHGKRYVACGRKPKCNFFEWIDDNEDSKSGWASSKERRVRCFCGDSLILRTSRTIRNPNRRFISCPNRRCKFFESVDGEDNKVTFDQGLGATRKEGASTGDVCLKGTKQDLGMFDAEIGKLEAQERKIEMLSVEIERLNVEFGQIENCVGKLCGEINVVQEQLGRLEDNMKKNNKRHFMLFLFFVILILALFVGRF